MGKFKGIVWRLYQSVLVLLVIGAIVGLVVDVNEYFEQEANRKALIKLLSDHLGDFKNSEIVDSSEDAFVSLPPNADISKLSDKQIFELAFGVKAKCLIELTETSGNWIYKCVSTPDEWQEENYTKYGLSRYSTIGGSLVPKYVGIWLALIAGLLAARYWCTWALTGAFPRRFP